MSADIKNDKDLVIAKMNHRTNLITAIIGGVVTILGVTVPVVISNNAKNTAAQQSANVVTTPTVAPTSFETKQTPAATATVTPTATPTEEDKPGKRGKE
jgi:hypothetical protein